MVSDCVRCQQHFKKSKDLERHLRTSPAHNICSLCGLDLSSRWGLLHHYIFSPIHHYCLLCDGHHASRMELIYHFEDVHHQCTICWLTCATAADLSMHYQYIHWVCLDCRRALGTPVAFHEHCRDVHWYCVTCKRVFGSEMSLKTHLRSTIHMGRTVECPGRKCLKAFVSGAALINHLESGACPSKMNRHHVNRLTVELDENNVITNPERLLGGPGNYVPPRVTVRTWATERSFNGEAYECVLCHKAFKTLGRLNEHLDSPAHDEKIYRCPRGWQGCGMEFGTLSALCQHVESEACGVHKFSRSIQKYVSSLGDGMKRLAL